MNAASSEISEQTYHPTRCNDPASSHLIKTHSEGRRSCIPRNLSLDQNPLRRPEILYPQKSLSSSLCISSRTAFSLKPTIITVISVHANHVDSSLTTIRSPLFCTAMAPPSQALSLLCCKLLPSTFRLPANHKKAHIHSNVFIVHFVLS